MPLTRHGGTGKLRTLAGADRPNRVATVGAFADRPLPAAGAADGAKAVPHRVEVVTTFRIRPARAGELPLISALEKSGDSLFRVAGMDLVADSPAPGPRAYEGAHSQGRLFVATGPADTPIGFVRVEMVDGCPHVEQVSVHPDHARKGVGSALMRAAEDWARSHGFTRLTLLTFRDVPWNGPFYSRLGWSPLPEPEWGPELAALRQHERDLGLDAWPRQAMIMNL